MIAMVVSVWNGTSALLTSSTPPRFFSLDPNAFIGI